IYPHKEDEIAVSASLKADGSLSLNDIIELSGQDGSVVNYSVVGFLDDAETVCLVTGSERIAALAPEGLSSLAGLAENSMTESYVVQFSRHCDIPDTVAEIREQYHISDDQITQNVPLLSIEGQLAGETGANQIFQVALVLSVIVMMTCILMISSSLNSNVAQRTEFFGMLRCLGATKKQIMRFVRFEGVYWCKTAIPIGLVISILIIWVLSAFMRLISPEWFGAMPLLGVSWISIVTSTLLGMLTVLLAARSPAKRAAKVSPLTAVSGNAGQTVFFRKAANVSLFKIETALGIHHAKARKKNYILMTGAFAVCIVLFLTFTCLVDFMEHAFTPPEWTPELSIVSETNTCSIDHELFTQVSQNEMVKKAYGRMFAYDVPAESSGKSYNANVISYEEYQFRWAADSLISGSIDAVMQQEDQVLFVQTENADIHAGDKVKLFVGNEEHEVFVAGILSDSPLARVENTETIFCSEKTFTKLTGQAGYTIIDVQFRNNASNEDVAKIENIFSDGGVLFTDTLLQVQQQRRLYLAFAVLVYGFLSIIVAITVFHIMNTIGMGVAAKMKEYGGMRAIGMSSRQLIRMIIAEAGTYAISGIIWGCIMGIPMHWVIYTSMVTNFWGDIWSVPFMHLILIICIVFIASFFAVKKPAKRLQNMSIVENINAQ
ncbi:MAG: ABC transporter permease, partial [Lachnospiraceae bacterium]|nr:ABC transporter permease [Lachnospiraceae bacterium]